MMKKITRYGNTITLHGDESITFLSGAMIDTDGSGPHHGDKTAQNDTSLHYRGEPLNADVHDYIVVPKWVAWCTRNIVLGSHCTVRIDGMRDVINAVVGDIGPAGKLGEISYSLAAKLGIPNNPNAGGWDVREVMYHIYPGQPAACNGRVYQLQPLKKG